MIALCCTRDSAEDASQRGHFSLAVITDVTALMDTARLLRESEARYRSLVEDQSDLVFLARSEARSPASSLRCATSTSRRAMAAKNFAVVPPETDEAGARVIATGYATRF